MNLNKRIYVLLAGLSLLFVACAPEEKGFQDYVQSLNRLDYPISFDIHSHYDFASGFDSTLYAKYKHTWAAGPYGIAYQNDSVIGIIEFSIGDVALAPLLTIYDYKGNKRDSLNLLGNTGFGENGQTISSAIIGEDGLIVVTDSSKTWEITDDYEEVPGTRKETVTINTYQIHDDGRFEWLEMTKKDLAK